MGDYYREIREYLADFWAYINEDDKNNIHYTKKQRQRLEDLVERARDKALIKSTLKSINKD
ncbi:hypothetical protein HYV89_03355 [Candidatus Woesearchaeota archaeon]|nr:hypothetical protein [Candidatus Woesearchaeota archaeon]